MDETRRNSATQQSQQRSGLSKQAHLLSGQLGTAVAEQQQQMYTFFVRKRRAKPNNKYQPLPQRRLYCNSRNRHPLSTPAG
ncbi:unnamed protein product [Ectocarpus sp. 8 AP-2014]